MCDMMCALYFSHKSCAVCVEINHLPANLDLFLKAFVMIYLLHKATVSAFQVMREQEQRRLLCNRF